MGLVVVVVVFVAVGALVYWRFQTANESSEVPSASQPADFEEASLGELDSGLSEAEANSDPGAEQEATVNE